MMMAYGFWSNFEIVYCENIIYDVFGIIPSSETPILGLCVASAAHYVLPIGTEVCAPNI